MTTSREMIRTTVAYGDVNGVALLGLHYAALSREAAQETSETYRQQAHVAAQLVTKLNQRMIYPPRSQGELPTAVIRLTSEEATVLSVAQSVQNEAREQKVSVIEVLHRTIGPIERFA